MDVYTKGQNKQSHDTWKMQACIHGAALLAWLKAWHISPKYITLKVPRPQKPLPPNSTQKAYRPPPPLSSYQAHEDHREKPLPWQKARVPINTGIQKTSVFLKCYRACSVHSFSSHSIHWVTRTIETSVQSNAIQQPCNRSYLYS